MSEFTARLDRFESYEQACRDFRWSVPDRFNIAGAVLGHPDAAMRPALIEVRAGGENTYTFGAIDFYSDKFASALDSFGAGRGDVVAVMLPQSASLAVAHLGALKAGCAVAPISESSSVKDFERAINSAEAKALIISPRARVGIDASNAPQLETIFIAADEPSEQIAFPGEKNFWREVYAAGSDFAMIETRADEPAFVFSKSDTGVVHSHSLLIGCLPAFEMLNDLDPADGVFYTPFEWASASTLLGVVYGAWAYGSAAIACPNAEETIEIAKRYEVTSLAISSNELKTWSKRRGLCLKHIYSFNESLPAGAKSELGVSIAQAYGSVEAPMMIASCDRWFSTDERSSGRVAPGHAVEIIDSDGNRLPAGQAGRMAIRRPDPALLTKHLGSGQSGDFFTTDDLWFEGEDGSLWLSARRK